MASQRELILTALVELCAEQGYEATTIEQVAERAGISNERFEELFGGDKEECLLAAMNTISGDLVAAISDSYSADHSEWDSYLHGTKAILELMAARPGYTYLAYVLARQMAPPRIRDARKATGDIVAAMLEQLWTYSHSEVQPPRMASAAVGMAEAVVRREAVAGRLEQLPRLLPDFVYGAGVAFLGQEEALLLSRRAKELLRDTDWG